MKKRIRVTNRAIINGDRHSQTECPIALAMRSLFRHGEWLRVRDDEVRIGDLHCYHCIPLPKSAKIFISRFDEGNPVKPFSFTITL
jgi:hypothetical protein